LLERNHRIMDYNITKEILLNYLDSFGLFLTLIGTFLIVFYIRKDPKEWVEDEDGQKSGEKWYALLIKHPRWLVVGVVFMIVGFLFSLFGSLLK
jgi:hypothetical protein